MFARDASVIDENADRRPLPDHKFGAGAHIEGITARTTVQVTR
jgi:hypothetical protein